MFSGMVIKIKQKVMTFQIMYFICAKNAYKC